MTRLEAMRTRIEENSGLELTNQQLELIIESLAVDEDLRLLFNSSVMSHRAMLVLTGKGGSGGN